MLLPEAEITEHLLSLPKNASGKKGEIEGKMLHYISCQDCSFNQRCFCLKIGIVAKRMWMQL